MKLEKVHCFAQIRKNYNFYLTILIMEFRYLIPDGIFKELTDKVKENGKKFIAGWLIAERHDNLLIVKNYIMNSENTQSHVKPKSWMRLKKDKIHQMRKYKEEENYEIVWQFHSHPTGKKELHEMDLKILSYLSTGVMIIITKNDILGWYYDKRDTKRPLIDKMNFEVINEFD